MESAKHAWIGAYTDTHNTLAIAISHNLCDDLKAIIESNFHAPLLSFCL